MSWRSDDGIQIRDLIAAALMPQQTGREDVIRMSSPELSVPAATAASLGMIICELTANAAKYGSL